jgi:hypothetical protein
MNNKINLETKDLHEVKSFFSATNALCELLKSEENIDPIYHELITSLKEKQQKCLAILNLYIKIK